MIFHARTGFLFASILSLVIGLALWAALWSQRNAALHYWCGGSLAAAAASLLIALRGLVPEVLGFTVPIALAVLMLSLKLQAIRLELNAPEPVQRPALLLLAALTGYELLRQGVGPSVGHGVGHGVGHYAHSLFALLVLSLMNARIAWWASRLGRRPGQRSAYWITWAFGLMAAAYGLRLVNGTLGGFDPNPLGQQGYDALLLGLTSFVGIIVSNIAWLSLALERLIRAQVVAAAAQARAEENRILSEQIVQLERQRSLGLLSASLAHELNQPLTAILTNAQVVRRGLGSKRIALTQALALLDKVVYNTQRAARILEHIRGLIRPSRTLRQPVDLVAVIQEVVELVAAQARAQACRMDCSLPQRPVRVAGDPIQISQLVLNVLRNAIEAASLSAGREIAVRLWEDDDGARLQVQDSGPGLSAEALQKAGEPFYTTKAQGLGLGLSISRTIARHHHGELTLSNTAGGALCELTLPLQSITAKTT